MTLKEKLKLAAAFLSTDEGQAFAMQKAKDFWETLKKLSEIRKVEFEIKTNKAKDEAKPVDNTEKTA